MFVLVLLVHALLHAAIARIPPQKFVFEPIETFPKTVVVNFDQESCVTTGGKEFLLMCFSNKTSCAKGMKIHIEALMVEMGSETTNIDCCSFEMTVDLNPNSGGPQFAINGGKRKRIATTFQGLTVVKNTPTCAVNVREKSPENTTNVPMDVWGEMDDFDGEEKRAWIGRPREYTESYQFSVFDPTKLINMTAVREGTHRIGYRLVHVGFFLLAFALLGCFICTCCSSSAVLKRRINGASESATTIGGKSKEQQKGSVEKGP